ncbi:MAG: toprim domain-containing protein [Ruthenibacterium lactatiformans]
MAAARNREIASLLAMRGFPLSRSGGEMHWRIPGEESVSIRGNMWYSHYRGKGGDAISFVRRFFHMDFKEAVRFLLEQSAAPAAGPVQCERQEQKQLRLPSKDSSEEQVRRYLTGIRKVSADVAGYFIETGQVYQSRAEGVRQGQEQCNLVLVGMDRDGAPRQAHIKGMRQRAFRYDAPGSDKAYGFRHMGGSGPLYVFEAAVDLMSYVSLCSEDWRQGNYLALNGTAEAALFRTLEEYPEVRGVVLALDNDAGGIEGVMRLTGLLREKGYTDVSVQLPAWKDWNEELKARGGMDAVCAQPHPKLQMLEQVKDAVLARALHAPRFVDGRYLEGTFQAACSAQADEIQNSCLQRLAAGALLRARHLFCTGGETTGLDRLADRAAELYQPHKDHITQDARLRSLGGQIQKMRAAEENMPARTAGQQAELADGWLHTAAAAMAADVSCMLKCPDGKVHRRKRKR